MTLPPRRRPAPGDLLLGEDHDFVVNAYLALLGRWPDDAGYHHYLDAVRNRPERRAEVLRALAGSEEARRAGMAMEIPPGPLLPTDPRQALAAALELRTGHLHAEIERLKEAVELLGGAELAGLGAELIEARDAALRSEIEAARREMRERVEALAGLLPAGAAGGALLPAGAAGGALAATAEERAARAVGALVAEYAAELLALAEARFEARLRGLEARLLRLGAAP